MLLLVLLKMGAFLFESEVIIREGSGSVKEATSGLSTVVNPVARRFHSTYQLLYLALQGKSIWDKQTVMHTIVEKLIEIVQMLCSRTSSHP
jgi:hypothetical protein